MASSEFEELQGAATEAHGNLARQRGMDDDADGNFLYAGTEYVGVFGRPQTISIPLPAGGYQRKTFLNLVVTKTQTDFSPAEKAKLTRIDVTPNLEYIIDTADGHSSLNWVVTLVKVAEK